MSSCSAPNLRPGVESGTWVQFRTTITSVNGDPSCRPEAWSARRGHRSRSGAPPLRGLPRGRAATASPVPRARSGREPPRGSRARTRRRDRARDPCHENVRQVRAPATGSGEMKMTEKNYGTSGGVDLTDELIDELAKEAERGYDLDRLGPRRGRGRT